MNDVDFFLIVYLNCIRYDPVFILLWKTDLHFLIAEVTVDIGFFELGKFRKEDLKLVGLVLVV